MQSLGKNTERTLKKKDMKVGDVIDNKNHLRRNYPFRLTLKQDFPLAKIKNELIFG